MTLVQPKIEPEPDKTLDTDASVSTTERPAWSEAERIRALELSRRLEAPVSDEADDLVIALELLSRREAGYLVSLEDAMRSHGFEPDAFQP